MDQQPGKRTIFSRAEGLVAHHSKLVSVACSGRSNTPDISEALYGAFPLERRTGSSLPSCSPGRNIDMVRLLVRVML